MNIIAQNFMPWVFATQADIDVNNNQFKVILGELLNIMSASISKAYTVDDLRKLFEDKSKTDKYTKVIKEQNDRFLELLKKETEKKELEEKVKESNQSNYYS